MELYIAGGCSEHGRNSFLVRKGDLTLLVDAGKMKEHPERPWPELTDEQIRSIDYLFLTHSHADHTGALPHLLERGFRGTVVAAAATLRELPVQAARTETLEHLGKPGEEIRVAKKLHVMWGRSGHCIGSVWYRFRMGKKTILFTGDYEEHSCAYRCDRIRGISADVAVVDCAYGFEREDSREHRRALEEALDALAARGKPMLFPVPSHGRGFDVIRLLAERGVPIILAESLEREYGESKDADFWLKKGFRKAVRDAETVGIGTFEAAFRRTFMRRGSFPRDYMRYGILVRDSQLVKNENRQVALGAFERGGTTVLTGKQDPQSFARKLLDGGKAEFCRISVHQNADEMMRLIGKNQFTRVVPYHCREVLSFDSPDISVFSAGDRIRF